MSREVRQSLIVSRKRLVTFFEVGRMMLPDNVARLISHIVE